MNLNLNLHHELFVATKEIITSHPNRYSVFDMADQYKLEGRQIDRQMTDIQIWKTILSFQRMIHKIAYSFFTIASGTIPKF